MKSLTIFLVCIAFLTAMTALPFTASAACASCEKEGDWSQTASNFIEGKTTSDEPVDFGPKAVRKTASQFENKTADAAKPSSHELILRSINVTPELVNSSSAAKITAVFALDGSDQAESQTEIQLTATATIKDATGKEVQKLSLIKASGNMYSNDWVASVPAGIYSVDIVASSLQGSANFDGALQIEVVGFGNATQAATAADNSS